MRGKENILFCLAEAAVDHPDDIVREALYPVAEEKTLRELVKEAKANDQVFQARVRTVLRSSYSNYYRRLLPALLAVLDFRCNNTVYRPAMVPLNCWNGRRASTARSASTTSTPSPGLLVTPPFGRASLGRVTRMYSRVTDSSYG